MAVRRTCTASLINRKLGYVAIALCSYPYLRQRECQKLPGLQSRCRWFEPSFLYTRPTTQTSAIVTHADLAGRHSCSHNPSEFSAAVMSELGAIVQPVSLWTVHTSPGLGIITISGEWFKQWLRDRARTLDPKGDQSRKRRSE